MQVAIRVTFLYEGSVWTPRLPGLGTFQATVLFVLLIYDAKMRFDAAGKRASELD
jgi:hypothetical protein